ncbi:MAG: acetyl-CoA C-acetyltransferase [Gammaproteobacteria bacterium]|nr:acetyl-CoA C-acetyltransferase [Gammaproteobacteria bacterium]
MSGRSVFLVDGARTPFLKTRGRPGPFTPVDLAVQCGRPLLLRQPLSVDAVDGVVLGCVNVRADEMNPARIAAQRLGLPATVPAYNVQINCGSGMLSVESAMQAIRTGRADLMLAGGAEALSHTPLVLSDQAVEWLASVRTATGIKQRLSRLARFRPGYLKPVVALERGLTDPIVDLSMGQTAEVLAHRFGIERRHSDTYALQSHQRLAHAQTQGLLDTELLPIADDAGRLYTHDDGVRVDTDLQQLSRLKPVFEPPHGQVTAGNSSQISDGASWLMLASERACERHELSPRARIMDSAWCALDPSIMGLAPTLCIAELLHRHRLSLDDIDAFEINEAFAAQVLACLAALEDDEYCRQVLGSPAAIGPIDEQRLNLDGGAISLGHPVGASGNRITLHLMHVLERVGGRLGIATECIGGGQGGAMLLERCQNTTNGQQPHRDRDTDAASATRTDS